MNFISNLLVQCYHSKYTKYVIPTTVSCLQNELADCKTILDLGCGPNSPLQFVPDIEYSIGVDIYKPYIEAAKKKRIHTEYKLSLIENLNFKKNSFDAVILIDVIEHLDKEKGLKILQLAEKWAIKKVILVTPNGFIAQGGYDKNKYQKHISGWESRELYKNGYTCHGLAGLKQLRRERNEDTKDADLTTSIRFKPRIFWFIIAVLSQSITYYQPQWAFSLFCVKRLKTT